LQEKCKMKKILILIGFIVLGSTSGCVIRERGGYYGYPEYEHGGYREYPHEHWDHYHWDERGYWRRDRD